ncbi:MAG TPA: hypothetical protein QGF58_04055 [Myxococcota bacterium]|nr:hypothetical protein [Myxococcota bacterium]
MLAVAVCIVLGVVCGSAWVALSMPETEAPEGVGDVLGDLVQDSDGDCLVPACIHAAEDALTRRSDLGGAERVLHHALGQEPDSPEAWLLLVEVDALRGGELDRARVLEAVERFHPGHEGLDRAHGAAALASDRLLEARSRLRDVDDPRLRADLHLALGELGEAGSLAESLLEADPADGHGCDVAARALWGRGLVVQAEARIAGCLEAGADLGLAGLSGAIAEAAGRHETALSRYVAAGDQEAEQRLRWALGEGVEAPQIMPDAVQQAVLDAREQNTEGAWAIAIAMDLDNAAIWREYLAHAEGPELAAALSELEAIDPQRFVLRRGLEGPWMVYAPSSWEEVLEKTDDHHCVRLLAGLPVHEGPALWRSASLSERGLGAEALALVEGDGAQARTARVAALLAGGRGLEAQAEALRGIDDDEPALRPLLALSMATRDDPEPALRAIAVILAEHPRWRALRAARYELSKGVVGSP